MLILVVYIGSIIYLHNLESKCMYDSIYSFYIYYSKKQRYVSFQERTFLALKHKSLFFSQLSEQDYILRDMHFITLFIYFCVCFFCSMYIVK